VFFVAILIKILDYQAICIELHTLSPDDELDASATASMAGKP
jgi:hypothetical protein